ncbi:MAG TPA: acyl-CoA dehydrogenase family protein [Candidatus Binataceae bacterium]|nr:acyl-CoA dehydrogenase family protein [Candidatus Binataceae bacterium]
MNQHIEDERDPIRSFVKRLTAKYDRRYWVDRASQGLGVDEMWRELGRAGYLGVTIPEEYGGSGVSMMRLTMLMEELSNQGVPSLFLVVSAAMGAIPIAKYGSEEQKRRYLPALADGREKFCFAITEPDAGSNSFKIRTLARRDGDHYVLSGQKVFISGADQANHMLVVARTTPADKVANKREGMSIFIVDSNAAGLERRKMDTRVLSTEAQFELFFDEVRIPAANRLGDEGAALKAMFDALNPERITVAAMSVGLGRYALNKAVAYAGTRKVFNVPIGAHQGLAHPMAIAKTNLELASLMTNHAAQVFDGGGDAGMYANMAKYAAAEAGIEAVDIAIQVHGGSGFTGETDVITLWPLVRLMRSAPVSREMILNYIGEHVLGLPRSY